MKLELMKKYQSVDKQLVDLEKSYTSSQTYREYNAIKGEIQNGKALREKNDHDAGDLIAQIESLMNQYDDLEKELKDAEDTLATVKDVKAADYLAAAAQKISNQMQGLIKEINNVNAAIEQIRKQSISVNNKLDDLAKKATIAKKKYDELTASVKPQVITIKKEKAALEANPDFSTKFLEIYNGLREQKVWPIVVPLNDRTCGGCFMELSADALANIDNDDIIRCPDCGRIIYKQ